MSPTNREHWLTQAVARFNEGLFEPNGYPLPPVKVSVGFPRGKAVHRQAARETDKDGVTQIFITPTLDDAIDALSALAGMLVEARFVTTETGKPIAPISTLERIAGIEAIDGNWAVTQAMREDYQLLADELGPYPHSAVNLKAVKPQEGRLIACTCSACGYKARTTRKWIKKLGTPLCPCNREPMLEQGAEAPSDEIPF